MDKPLLVINNKHVMGCGDPPLITNAQSNCYFGYYENIYGEQWVFIYNRETGSTELRGGDVGWQQTFEVIDGKAPALILNEGERIWLRNCWETATRNL